ncbi:MAG TPA: peptidoglycan DD-metalloendopeptidase family protein, partial [Rhizomicrobium sp.]|nr:peptidoglycan DD-metalloendopeptidase family protein [Rhizomicrobium sp.]
MRGILLALSFALALPGPAFAAPAKKVPLDVTPAPRPALNSDAPPDVPLDLSKAMPGKAMGQLPSSAQQLNKLQTEMARDKPAVANAKQKSDQLSQEASALRRKLIETAAKVESLEQETITLDGEIARLQQQNDALTKGFERDRISVTKLLAILERLQHDMPPALAVRPDDALAAARGSMLVGASLPPLYSQAAKLAARIDALRTTRLALLKRRADAARVAGELTNARGDLETLTTQKEAEAQQAGGEYDTLKSRLAVIAAQAADFQALADRVAVLRRTTGDEGGIVTVTAASAGSAGSLAKNSLLPPVVGTILTSSGGTAEDSKESGKNPGVIYATIRGAQVIAPADGRVLFAGPYHKSGQVLILEITTGYDLVLAGLGRVTVRPNDELLAGEPVGNMPAEGPSPIERLYFELRENGHGLDPRPWLSL